MVSRRKLVFATSCKPDIRVIQLFDMNFQILPYLAAYLSKYRVRIKVRIFHDLGPLLTPLHHGYDLYYVSSNLSMTLFNQGNYLFIYL